LLNFFKITAFTLLIFVHYFTWCRFVGVGVIVVAAVGSRHIDFKYDLHYIASVQVFGRRRRRRQGNLDRNVYILEKFK